MNTIDTYERFIVYVKLFCLYYFLLLYYACKIIYFYFVFLYHSLYKYIILCKKYYYVYYVRDYFKSITSPIAIDFCYPPPAP